MSDPFDLGVLYTDHRALAAGTPLASLWSYRSCRPADRPEASLDRPDGSLDLPHQYWLHRSDPLLNTILPGTHLSIVVNAGDRWAAGRSLSTTSLLPPVAVFGPFTEPRLLRVGRQVRAIGAVIPALLSRDITGVPANALLNQIVALEDLWPSRDVERLGSLTALRDVLLQRLDAPARVPTLERSAAQLLTARGGQVSIGRMAAHYGISRQLFARRFHDAAGLSPKLFGRIVRFQGLVHALLSNDVSQWASVASHAGFYDQAHMINDFRGFAGAPPTVFFQPHDDTIDPARIQVRGRPSEWLR